MWVCGYSVVVDSGIFICVGVSFGSVGGCSMVGVGLKAHLSHALNFEAIPYTKTYFWWWCGVWFLGFRFVVIYLVDLGFAQQLGVCFFFFFFLMWFLLVGLVVFLMGLQVGMMVAWWWLLARVWWVKWDVSCSVLMRFAGVG